MAGNQSKTEKQVIIDKDNPVIMHVEELDGKYMKEFQWQYESGEWIQDFTSYTYLMQLDDELYKPGEKIEKNPAGLKSFEYHCAHSYWSFWEVAAAIFGSEGEAAADQVMADFEAEYGKEMAETLASYKNTNFNIA